MSAMTQPKPKPKPKPFWQRSPLSALTSAQWEALCDGCGKCCLHKLEDEDSRRVYYTNVACELLDPASGRCREYPNRTRRVPGCVVLTPALLADPYWLPRTCAYRRLAEGLSLPDWHPLVSGDPDSVRRAGHAVAGRVIPEAAADDLEQHLIDWVE
jgi:uncharacterized cysteine cluster protein YcgN (CxxCxxCC family)